MRTATTAAAALLLSPATWAGPPQAPRHPVTETYWGVEVTDDYRYLEAVDDEAVAEWAAAQNEYTREWLDSRPEHAAILERVQTLTHGDTPEYRALAWRGGRLFAMKRQPPIEQPFLVVFPPGALSGERVLVDPNAIDPAGLTSIDFYEPSLDGRRVAVSLSQRGTEAGTLHVFDVDSGAKLDDVIPRANGGTAGGSVAWNADGTGLYYARYPHPGERPDEDLFFYQQVWFHEIGSPAARDAYELGRDFPRIAEIELDSSDDGQWLVAEVSLGDGGEYRYYARDPAGDWSLVADYDDGIIHAEIDGDTLYLLSRDGAPNKKVLALPLGADLDAARVVVPESDAVIRSFRPADGRIYVAAMLGGPTGLRVYDEARGTHEVVDAGGNATISGFVRLDRAILLASQSYLTPAAWYRFDPAVGRLEPTPLAHTSPADFSDCVVERVFAPAAGGVRIPITVVRQRATPVDGSAPLLLYGYGSYGFTLSPYFSAHRRLWIEQGGIYAVANIRGGGAYGDDWHRAANLQNKIVSIDDFAACARYLAQQHYTSRERLAIEGGSAGGLLVYGVTVHHPEVASAVLAHVGIADTLRFEHSPNGQFNVTEFGTVGDEDQFRGLYALSPYHHARDGTEYPALLATTGMNDPRVEPWQSFKMVARLQASGTSRPVLLRVSTSTGHGRGTGQSQRDLLLADGYTFLFAALGVPYSPK